MKIIIRNFVWLHHGQLHKKIHVQRTVSQWHHNNSGSTNPLTLDHQRTAKLNNSKDIQIIEEGSVSIHGFHHCHSPTQATTFPPPSQYLYINPSNHHPARVLPWNSFFLLHGKYFEQVQPWVTPLAPSMPTCSWKSLKLRPSVLPLSPVYDLGMLMTLLSFNRHNVATSSSSLSIVRTNTSNSPWKTPVRMVPYLSWIPLFPWDSTTT